MRSRSRLLGLVFVAVSLLASLSTTGCATRSHRYYDPYHSDYHHWDNHEQVYYQQWTVENHQDPHRDFRHLNKDQQHDYWNWRHSHPDNDHDHDHDHDHH